MVGMLKSVRRWSAPKARAVSPMTSGLRCVLLGAVGIAALVVLVPKARADDLTVFFESDGLVAPAKAFLLSRARHIRAWARTREVVAAVRTQNASGLTLREIQKIDEQWVAGEPGVAQGHEVLTSPCADELRRLIAMAPPGYYREAFATDANGALVCATERTSDYWQGDEAKWIRAYNDGSGGIYIGPVQFDESVGHPLVQIAVPIVADDRVIGVLVVGKIVQNLELGRKLERRRAVD